MKKRLMISAGFLAAFALWTAAVCLVDVRPIGPHGSAVGLAGLNSAVHDLTGVHLGLYTVTDWLGLVPIATCMGFGALGLGQWIRRKSIRKVDYDILVLGGFYAVTIAAYLFFESVVVNYRPILIDGVLEASYPSSTTTLVLCVMPTAVMQLRTRIKHGIFKRCVVGTTIAFIAVMVVGRLLSGVHWFTDIVGGALLSTGLVLTYRAVAHSTNLSKDGI